MRLFDDQGGYSCSACHRTYTPQKMIDLGRRHPPMLAREIAKTLNIAPATIRTWEHRGLITAVKRNHQGRKLYSLADAISVKADWGHSSNIVAVELCQAAQVRTLAMFHHEPAYNDAQIERVLQETRRFEQITRDGHALEVLSAWDGLELTL